MNYLFGPVPSRRLGVSLGVDLVPYKVCSLNCVYCEVGHTTNLTIERKEFIPIEEIIKELDGYLSHKPELDFITFSGQGEPTLNSGLGKVIDFIKDNFPLYKVAVITNGTLFWDKEVRDEVKRADVLLPSLDAVSELIFRRLNRPSRDLQIERIIGGLVKLRQEFNGDIYLEVFFVPGLNDTESELVLLKREITKIKPDMIQLNTLDRPGTESWVKSLTQNRLTKIREFFKPLSVDIISNSQIRKQIQSFNENIQTSILETIKRRPSTDVDLCKILNLHINELNKYISFLLESEQIETEQLDRGMFFKIRMPNKSD